MKYLVLLIYTFSVYSRIYAQDAGSDFTKLSDRKDWGFTLSPYAWIAGQSTDVGGEKLRQSFNDLSSLTNFGFQLSSSLRYKRYILSFDGTYANLGSGVGADALKVDFSIDQWIIDSKIGYLIFDDIHYNENEVIAGWSIEGNIGLKYWSNDVNINYGVYWNDAPLIEEEINELQKWYDLMLGVKTRIILSKYVLLGIGGNIGGFGIGNSSKLSWDFTYVNSFRMSDLITVSAGYRHFKYNRVDGEGSEQLETTVSAFGPMLGVSFVF